MTTQATRDTVSPSPENGRRGKPKKPRAKYNRREAIAGYLFISPWIIGFLVFTFGAMAYSLYISFSDYRLVTNTATPAGFSNYEELFEDPKVMTSLQNTLFYAVLAVPFEIVLALGLAMLLARLGKGAGLFRTIYYLPKMTPSVATAAVFLLLLNGNTGAINEGLALIGIQGPQWLIDPDWVKPSIVLMTLWGVAGTMVIFLAALKNVPRDLYEVASIDGAGPVRQFFAITVPMISGATFFNIIVLSIAALQTFDQAYLLFYRDSASAGAAPEASLFYAVYLYIQAFRQFNFGVASAMAWLLFAIILVITFIQVKFGNRFVYYEGDKD